MAAGEQIRVGIAGCGTIAAIHAQAIARVQDAELISVYSRNPENARRLAKKYDVAAHHHWSEFIREGRLDVVSVCTPSGTHLEFGAQVASAGLHVIMEKPIEVTLQRGRELMRTCESNGASLAVIYQNRFLPEVARMKELLEGDAIGPVFLADASVKWFRDQAYYDGAMWRGTRKFDGGGVLINQAIHTIDLLQWFLGETELAFGCTSTRTHYRLEGEDNAVATLRFESGTLAVIEASTSVVPAQERKISLYGERGTLELDGNTLRHKSNDRTETTSMTGSGGAADPMQNVSAELHRRQFEAIFEALRAGEQPPVSGEESLRSLAIVEGIYRSAKTGMPTNICDLWS